MLVLACSFAVEVGGAAAGITVCTKAAFGLNVPANPPLSFHALTAPPTVMAMSWLNPLLAVHRSALPPMRITPAEGAVNETVRLVASMSFHVAPSLPVRVY